MKKTVKPKKGAEEALLLKNQLARALADYDNLKRRVDIEKATFEKIANLRIIIRLLPVLDILRQAQAHLKDQGIAITIKEFEGALEQEGIEEIKVNPGEKFDQDMHEVVEVVSGKDNNIISGGNNISNVISEVVLSGYRFTGGPVIRHARVKVTQTNDIPKE